MDQSVEYVIAHHIVPSHGPVKSKAQAHDKAGVEGLPDQGQIKASNRGVIGDGLEVIKYKGRLEGVGINDNSKRQEYPPDLG